MQLWTLGADPDLQAAIHGTLVRLVESQEQIATTGLVDDLGEQALLEDMLEATKPPHRPGTEAVHYLLATPFRYPPLRHGSRFGAAHEPSLFYGAHRLLTALTETAYYRFVFWEGMRTPPPSGRLITQHTAFGARYKSPRGLRLQSPPFDTFESQLRNREDYTATQRLGSAMRDAGIEAFEYLCARTRLRAVNVGLFTPRALIGKQPLQPNTWLCETRTEQVSFRAAAGGQFHTFPRTNFLVDGTLPHPAA